MAIQPGWDSVEGVTAWHRRFQVAKWAFAACAVAMEITVLLYSQEREQLQEERRAIERVEADRRIREAQRVASSAWEEALGRQVTAAQGDTLKRILGNRPKGDLQIFAGDRECLRYSDQLVTALKTAGWSAQTLPTEGFDPEQGSVNVLYIGCGASCNGLIRANRVIGLPHALVPPAAFALADAFSEAGVQMECAVTPHAPAGELRLQLGYKP